MATVTVQPQDTPQPVVSPPMEASEPVPDKISAYYSLTFPNFTYYVQTIAVTIGRRSTRTGEQSSSDQPEVDVDLGPLKSVSRLHAKIEYDQDSDRFVLDVIGRNGAWVDGVWCGSGTRAPLGERPAKRIKTEGAVFEWQQGLQVDVNGKEWIVLDM